MAVETHVNSPSDIQAFTVDIPQAQLDDLRLRIGLTRWPDQLPGVGWAYGAPLDYIRDLAAYWSEIYDWRREERRLNAFDQFTTSIDGKNVHFYHVRSAVADATPLMLMHGFPGSVVEFLPVIEALIDPAAHGGEAADAFHLIIPSIPGYGWSGPTKATGRHPSWVGGVFIELMARLGYARYGALAPIGVHASCAIWQCSAGSV